MPIKQASVEEVFDIFEECFSFLDDPQEKITAIVGQDNGGDEQSFAV